MSPTLTHVRAFFLSPSSRNLAALLYAYAAAVRLRTASTSPAFCAGPVRWIIAEACLLRALMPSLPLNFSPGPPPGEQLGSCPPPGPVAQNAFKMYLSARLSFMSLAAALTLRPHAGGWHAPRP